MKSSFEEVLFSFEGGVFTVNIAKSANISLLPAIVNTIESYVRNLSVTVLRVEVSSKVAVNTALFILLERLGGLCSMEHVKLEIFAEEKSKELINILKRYVLTPIPVDVKPVTAGLWQDKISRVGSYALEKVKIINKIYVFVRNIILCFSLYIRNPKIIRFRELVYIIQHTGSGAMPIVAIMSFLIGLVTAFQAAVQLRLFGANIFVADLSALALSRELSPLITSVLMAGRTTSAFAAEIGTMKINEEIDALKVMNVDIAHFLILPRVLGAIISAPLLTFWSLFTGLLGGLFVAILWLDVTLSSFVSEIYGALGLKDLWVGVFKSFLFGIIVGSVGCFMGLETGGSPDSVGKQTTSAVVTALFLIIVADAFVTVLAHIFKW